MTDPAQHTHHASPISRPTVPEALAILHAAGWSIQAMTADLWRARRPYSPPGVPAAIIWTTPQLLATAEDLGPATS